MKRVPMKTPVVNISQSNCPNCKKPNSKWRSFCQHCKKPLNLKD